MTEQYFYIKTNNNVELGTFDGLEKKQEAVGGLIERVWLSDDRYMWANEEGLLQKLPLNHVASKIAGQPIVGDVLLVSDEDMKSYKDVVRETFMANQKADKVTE